MTDGGQLEAELEEEEITKKTKILNVFLAGGIDTETSDIQELVDCSRAYVSRLRKQIKSGEIKQDDIAEARNPTLTDTYSSYLGVDQPISPAQLAGGDTGEAPSVEVEDTSSQPGSVEEQQTTMQGIGTSDGTSETDLVDFSDSLPQSRSEGITQLSALQQVVHFELENTDKKDPSWSHLARTAYIIEIALNTVKNDE